MFTEVLELRKFTAGNILPKEHKQPIDGVLLCDVGFDFVLVAVRAHG